MSRGSFYSKEEDESLMAIYDDLNTKNGNKRFIDAARKAQKYGICKTRNESALAQHIASLVNPPEAEEKQFNEAELVFESVNKQLEEFKAKYESLVSTILENDKLTENGLLWIDFNKLTRWFYKNEPQRYLDRIEMLNKDDEWE